MAHGRLSLGSIVAALVLVCVSSCGDDDDAGSNGGDGGGRGGTSAGGGSGGTGSAMNPAACPAQAPADGVACTMLQLSCTYGSTQCTCAPGFTEGNSWDCNTGGGGNTGGQMCPSAEPKVGDMCMPARGDCMFGTRVCDCLNDANTWVCWDPAMDCPAARPAEQAACPLVGIQCDYGRGMMGGDCDCTDMGWDCGRQFCPTDEPASASTCEPGPGMCMYGTRICECGNDTDAWACWDPADCPATQPAEQAACNPVGMTCDYGAQGGNDCDCEDTGWDCGAQFCPATAPTAAEACEGGEGVCSYDAANVCDCDSMIWVCWNPADCPATPMEASACTAEGMICTYGTGDCECDDLVWACDLDGDADGGV